MGVEAYEGGGLVIGVPGYMRGWPEGHDPAPSPGMATVRNTPVR